MKGIESKIQYLLNRYLALDSESHLRLKKLHDKVITIELLGLNYTFQLVFNEDKVLFSQTNFLTPHTTIKGTPFTLVHMALSRQDRKRFFSDDVSIEGNLELGQQVIDLFDQIEIDWEEFLSRWVGDVSAYHLGNAVRKTQRFANHARKILLENINEYTHEEADLFPPTEALQDFFNEVDKLRMDVDRASARIEKLKRG